MGGKIFPGSLFSMIQWKGAGDVFINLPVVITFRILPVLYWQKLICNIPNWQMHKKGSVIVLWMTALPYSLMWKTQ